MSARAALLVALGLAAAACTPRERTVALTAIDQNQGYRYFAIDKLAPKRLDDSFIAVTFSGGGTRAAALAHGALKALSGTVVPVRGGDAILADEIDIISSVSGGSVTAAYFALKGRDGMPAFERGFLRHNVQGELIGTVLNPVTWFALATPAYARIDILRDYFNDKVFEQRAYRDLMANGPGPGRRPYVVINAADMATGHVFSFNQDQFDLLCADLSQLNIADAVAASAAFPVALTALTLKNRSRENGKPCRAQADAPNHYVTSGWKNYDGQPRPVRIVNDIGAGSENPGRARRGRVALSYLNEDGRSDYVQLLDGGIADNLGLTEPLTLLTSLDRSPSILARMNRGSINKLVMILVNARSEPDIAYGSSATPPGAISTLLTTIGTPIDSSSFLLIDRLDDIINRPQEQGGTTKPRVQKSLVMVDFDFIDDPACRRRFKNISTSWALPETHIDALIKLGEAMVRESKPYNDMVNALGGHFTTTTAGHGVADACALLAYDTH